ncbi:MAG: hypothetical protein PHQ96_04110 [Candidatus Omnitrophica bacterium]|nr:hypothetical protein [Candidatus Omnitrophota bacterium]
MPRKGWFWIALSLLVVISGCATTDILKTPLKYGKALSDDSVEFTDCGVKTVSEAIDKVTKREGQSGVYAVEKISDNTYSIKITDWANFYEYGIGSQLTGRLLQKKNYQYTFNVILSSENNNTAMKAEGGRSVVTATGESLQPGTSYMYSGRTNLLPYGVTTSNDSEQVNKGLYGPFEREMKPEELQYCFKDFSLLLEKFLPKAK